MTDHLELAHLGERRRHLTELDALQVVRRFRGRHVVLRDAPSPRARARLLEEEPVVEVVELPVDRLVKSAFGHQITPPTASTSLSHSVFVLASVTSNIRESGNSGYQRRSSMPPRM